MEQGGYLSLMTFLGHLTGPIFDKELRVASRRKRYYVLRSLYLLMLAILVAVVWFSQNASLRLSGSVYSASRMAEVGRAVIVSVVWFQFIGCQIASILFFSHSICEEMNRGTLNVLMSTPITSVQIVVGKFFSKLVQVCLVLCLSLSTLSIIYMFGGVHWSFIIASFCITLSAVVFSSALTMFFSGRLKRSYVVILVMIIFFGVFYSLGIILGALLPFLSFSNGWLIMVHPGAAMLELTQSQLVGATAGGNVFAWWGHCLIMIGISLVLIACTVIRLRKSMLVFAFEKTRKTEGVGARFRKIFLGTRSGYPISLKGVSRRKWFTFRCLFLVFILIAGYAAAYYTYYLSVGAAGIGGGVFRTFSMTVWLVVFVRTMVAAATAITKEKEGRTLSALLCCPMSDGKIIFGKALDVIWANRALWFVLLLNASLSMFIYQFLIFKGSAFDIMGGVIFSSIISIVSVLLNMLLIVSLGLYISVRVKSSTSAVIGGVLGYFVWYFLRYIIRVIPMILFHHVSFYMVIVFLYPAIELLAGVFFLWRAKRLLRKCAFA